MPRVPVAARAAAPAAPNVGIGIAAEPFLSLSFSAPRRRADTDALGLGSSAPTSERPPFSVMNCVPLRWSLILLSNPVEQSASSAPRAESALMIVVCSGRGGRGTRIRAHQAELGLHEEVR